MLNRIGLIGLAGAAAVAVFLACGGDGQTGGLTCTTDGDCLAGEICHPEAGVCVQTCESGADCPDSAKNCDTIVGTSVDGGTGQKICQCTTDQLCAGGAAGTGAVCMEAFDVCMAACASNTDCPSGFECETSTGQCTATGGGTCSPACTGDQVCDPNTNTCVAKCTFGAGCSGTQMCNLTTGVCEAAPACTASDPQPSGCQYGAECANSNCQFVPDVTAMNCTNFGSTTDPEAQAALNWTPDTGTGPVIWDATKESQDTTWCDAASATPKNVRVRVKAYQGPNGTFPTTLGSLQGFFYVKVDGANQDATQLIRPTSGYTVTNNGKNAEFLLNFCIPASQNMLQIGLFFTNGNAFCGDFEQQ